MKEKECSKCQKIKNVKEFYKDRNNKDGYNYHCKNCVRLRKNKFTIKCVTCGKEHKTANKNVEYCSNKCKPQNQSTKVIVSCFICNKIVDKKKSQYDRANYHYCSQLCKNKGFSINYSGENNGKYKRVNIECDYCGELFIKKNNEITKYKNHYCSNECRYQGFSNLYTGENHPSWNPSLTDEERIESRNYPEYHEWRKLVFERDNYTCQCCGDNTGGNLVAHHILNYSEHPHLRTKTSNGITLCKTCHKQFHDTYGYTNNNKTQLEEFINNTRNSVVYS